MHQQLGNPPGKKVSSRRESDAIHSLLPGNQVPQVNISFFTLFDLITPRASNEVRSQDEGHARRARASKKNRNPRNRRGERRIRCCIFQLLTVVFTMSEDKVGKGQITFTEARERA